MENPSASERVPRRSRRHRTTSLRWRRVRALGPLLFVLGVAPLFAGAVKLIELSNAPAADERHQPHTAPVEATAAVVSDLRVAEVVAEVIPQTVLAGSSDAALAALAAAATGPLSDRLVVDEGVDPLRSLDAPSPPSLLLDDL